MSAHGDNRGDGTPGRVPHGTAPNSRQHVQMPWLPMPQAPANDNEAQLLGILYTFFGRHMRWLAPTLLLTAVSLALLFSRSS